MEQFLSPRPFSASWFVPMLLSFLILTSLGPPWWELCMAPRSMPSAIQAVLVPLLLNSHVTQNVAQR